MADVWHRGGTRPEWPEMVVGGKSIRGLLPLLERLPPLSDHPNRDLQTRDVLVAHLIAFFNPTLRSLRTLEDVSRTRQAGRLLAVDRLPKSTLAPLSSRMRHRLIDPAVLEPIVAHLLRETARRGLAPPADLPAALRQVLAVDGTFLSVAADVAWAVRHATNTGQKRASVRLDVPLDVASGLPRVVNVHGAGTGEAASAAENVQPGAVHVYDRGVFRFALIKRHVELSRTEPTPFVLRMCRPGPRGPGFAPLADGQRPPTGKDLQAGVLSDRLGRLTGSTHRCAPDAVLRLIEIAAPDEPGGVVRLLTDLLDLPAPTVGLLYRYRWQVELFFRWLKAAAHFRHLLSQRREAIKFDVYVAVIGTLLLALRYNARPSRYAYALLHQVACGGASAAEIAPILAERERRCALDRESQRRRRTSQPEIQPA